MCNLKISKTRAAALFQVRIMRKAVVIFRYTEFQIQNKYLVVAHWNDAVWKNIYLE